MRRFSTFASVSLVESNTVDDLDRQLAQCLGVDGRASFSAIAEVLGVSDQTVARRYRRLRSAGVLRVVGLKYPKPAGYANWFLRLRCVPGSGEGIAAALAKRPDTAWVQLLSGDTEVLCSLRGVDADGTESLLSRMPRSGRIVAVTAYSRLHMFTGGPDALGFMDVLPLDRVAPLRVPGPVRGRTLPSGAAAEGLSDLDEALFAALALDGRTPYAELAAACGWSETTVRRRMDQLRDLRLLYYDLELDMPSFGFRSPAWLWLSVPPTVGDTLTATQGSWSNSPTTFAFQWLKCLCLVEVDDCVKLFGKTGIKVMTLSFSSRQIDDSDSSLESWLTNSFGARVICSDRQQKIRANTFMEECFITFR